MPSVGMVDTLTITLDVWGSDTQLTAVIKPPEGAAVAISDIVPVDPPTDHPEQAKRVWRGTVLYTMPGIWVVIPTVTGTGYGSTAGYQISVGPAGADSDPRHTYATSRAYANITGQAPPLDIVRRLADASAVVDTELHFAVYPVDDDGMPTDPAHIEALMLATVEVARWWDANGWDGSGAEGAVQSASIAGVSLGFTAGKQAGKIDNVGGKARSILAAAGLIGGAASAPASY